MEDLAPSQTLNAVDDAEIEPEVPSVADILFNELSDDNGYVDPNKMHSGWLESVRQRVIDGSLPRFITPDHKEGWEIYARSRVNDLFIRKRTRLSGHDIRRFFPLLTEMHKATGLWADGEEDEDAAVRHAEDRMTSHIGSAIQLHGPVLMLRGGMTWDEIRLMGHTAVNTSVDKTAGMDTIDDS